MLPLINPPSSVALSGHSPTPTLRRTRLSPPRMSSQALQAEPPQFSRVGSTLRSAPRELFADSCATTEDNFTACAASVRLRGRHPPSSVSHTGCPTALLTFVNTPHDLPHTRRALTGPHPSRSILATSGSRSAWETLVPRAPDSRVSTTKRFLRVGRFTRECSCQARPLCRRHLIPNYTPDADPHTEAAGERLDDPFVPGISPGEPTYLFASFAPSIDVVHAYAAGPCFCEGWMLSSRLCVDPTTHRNPG